MVKGFSVTPWEVEGNVNYEKLIKEFGLEPSKGTPPAGGGTDEKTPVTSEGGSGIDPAALQNLSEADLKATLKRLPTTELQKILQESGEATDNPMEGMLSPYSGEEVTKAIAVKAKEAQGNK